MSSGSSGSGWTAGRTQRLFLRAFLPGAPPDEVYVVRRLSIGRAVDNFFCVDDPAVDRHHAEVEIDEQSRFVLRCLTEGAFLQVGEEQVSKLVLEPGVRFRVGPAEFECLAPSVLHADTIQTEVNTVCPYCGTARLPQPAPARQACEECGQLILVLPLRSQDVPLVLPCRVSQLEALRLVGQGGMAIVLEGRRVDNAQRVAIKLMLPELAAQGEYQERFRREIAVLRKVRHPNVVQIVGWGHWGPLPCLVMNWVEGESLKRRIEENRREGGVCPFPQARNWFIQVLQGLQAIHRAGLVHRDIKPSNILIDRSGQALVADLGIARRLQSEATALTTSSTMVGTWVYMAPEQIYAPDRVDHRADQYGLGATFYELLTAQPPVGRWVPPSQKNPSVPPEFDQLLARLLSAEPNERFTSVADIMARLGCSPPEPSEGTILMRPPPLSRQAAPELCKLDKVQRPPRPPVSAEQRSHGQHAPQRFNLFSIFTPSKKSAPPLARAAQRPIPTENRRLPPRLVSNVDVGSAARNADTAEQPVLRVPRANGPLSSAMLPRDDDVASLPVPSPCQPVITFPGRHLPLWFARYSPDGRKIATLFADQTVKIWDASSGKVTISVPRPTSRRKILEFIARNLGLFPCASFSPDGQRIVIASCDRALCVYNTTTGDRLLKIGGLNWQNRIDTLWRSHTLMVACADYSPDGRAIVTASWRTAQIWDANSGALLVSLRGHSGRINFATYSADARRIVTASRDCSARIWDANIGRCLLTLFGHAESVCFAAYSWDTQKVVTASADKTAKVWDACTAKLLLTCNGHTDTVRSANFSPDGQKIVTASHDNTARVWDANTGELLRTLTGHTDLVTAASYHPNGQRIITSSMDGSARIWDAATGLEILQLVATSDGAWMAFSQQGYFVGNPKGLELIRHFDGLGRFVSPEESRRYYRPDIVRKVLAGE